MEETQQTDPATGRKIRVSTTARKLYRLVEQYQGIRNAKLNEIIAKDFIESARMIQHHFVLTKQKKEIGEIRGSSDIYFVSAIRPSSVDILTIQGKWVEPKYKVKDSSKLRLED